MSKNKIGKVGLPKDLPRKSISPISHLRLAFDLKMPVKQTNVPGFMFTVTFTDDAIHWNAVPAPKEEPVPV